MDLNDLIDQKGEGYLAASEIDTSHMDCRDLTSLEGIERFPTLTHISCESRLLETYFKTHNSHLEGVLGLSVYCPVRPQLHYLSMFPNLETISIFPSHDSRDRFDVNDEESYILSFDGCGLDAVKNTLRKFAILGSNIFHPLQSLRFMKDFEKLKHLDINHIGGGVFLDFPENLGRTLTDITLNGTDDVTDVCFLESCTSLRSLTIERSGELSDFSGAGSVSTLKIIQFLSLPGLVSLEFLRTLNLNVFSIVDCENMTDYSPLNCKNLRASLTDLSIGSAHFDNLKHMREYAKLCTLDIGGTLVRDITILHEFESVKNGSLTALTVPESVDWAGNMENGATVLEMRKRGIDVRVPKNFHYKDEFEQKSKLYIICGPSGAGKTTLINYMVNELGVNQLRKTTTRTYRSGENISSLICVTQEEFDSLTLENKLLGAHKYHQANYGVNHLDFLDAYLSKDTYLFDICDPETAFALRDCQPDFIEVVMLLPTAELVERGLKMRDLPAGRYDRLKTVEAECLTLSAYARHADHIIGSHSYTANNEEIRRIIRS